MLQVLIPYFSVPVACSTSVHHWVASAGQNFRSTVTCLGPLCYCAQLSSLKPGNRKKTHNASTFSNTVLCKTKLWAYIHKRWLITDVGGSGGGWLMSGTQWSSQKGCSYWHANELATDSLVCLGGFWENVYLSDNNHLCSWLNGDTLTKFVSKGQVALMLVFYLWNTFFVN